MLSMCTISIIEFFEPKSRKVKDKQSHVVYSLSTSEPGVQVQVAFLKKLFYCLLGPIPLCDMPHSLHLRTMANPNQKVQTLMMILLP